MNKPNERTSEDHGEALDALADAMLSEHARLGTHDDVGLLASVRARTVDKPAPLPEPKAIAFSPADRWKVAAMVAAVIGVLGIVTSRIETSGPESDTLQLVMRPLSLTIDSETPDSEGTSPRRVRILKEPSGNATLMAPVDFPLASPETLALSSPPSDSPELSGNGYEFEKFASLMLPATELSAHVSVAANRTIRNNENRNVVYEGSVQLAHPDFRITADRLEFSKQAEGDDDRFGTFVATGDAVRVEKRTPSGGLQIAEGLRVSYDADGGTLTLSGGPPRLKSGGSQVVPDSPGGAIVLRQDGFQVIETAMLGAPVFR